MLKDEDLCFEKTAIWSVASPGEVPGGLGEASLPKWEGWRKMAPKEEFIFELDLFAGLVFCVQV